MTVCTCWRLYRDGGHQGGCGLAPRRRRQERKNWERMVRLDRSAMARRGATAPASYLEARPDRGLAYVEWSSAWPSAWCPACQRHPEAELGRSEPYRLAELQRQAEQHNLTWHPRRARYRHGTEA